MNDYDSKNDTLGHILNVSQYINIIISELTDRRLFHDVSKLKSPEKEIFDEYTPKLKQTTYGSDEYKQYLDEMKVALKHHYSENRHHPEHFENGINDMTLIDINEMFCDWMAATKRQNDGDILKSIEINQIRFGISDQLVNIFKNTAKVLNA
jgi:hypothetical protein